MHLFLLSFIFSHFFGFNHIILFIMGSSLASLGFNKKRTTQTQTLTYRYGYTFSRERERERKKRNFECVSSFFFVKINLCNDDNLKYK